MTFVIKNNDSIKYDEHPASKVSKISCHVSICRKFYASDAFPHHPLSTMQHPGLIAKPNDHPITIHCNLSFDSIATHCMDIFA